VKIKVAGHYILDDYLSSGLEETQNPFITENSRLWGNHTDLISSIFSFLLLAASYGASFFSSNLSNFLLVVVYFFVGTPALIDTLKDLLKLKINIEVLMTLAAFLSIAIGAGAEGALLLVLFAISHALEHMVTQKTKGALSSLQKIAPSMALVLDESGETYQKSVREILPNTVILIRSGEIIPLDGKVIKGSSYVNLAHLTGESIPQSKTVGDEVHAGSLNTDGSLTLEVTKTSGESALAKIIELITKAQESKPKLQRFLDRFGSIYASTIIVCFILIAALLPFIFNIPYLSVDGSIYRSLAFLIAASPCALIIGAPTAYLGSISACAKKGILLKGGVVLDALAGCTKLFFDKTGTLTTGKLKCEKLEVISSTYDENFLLQIAAGLENGAHHPIADAILAYTKEKSIPLYPVYNVKTISGSGVEGEVEINGVKHKAFAGSPDFIFKNAPKEITDKAKSKIDREGKVVALCLIDSSLLIFHFLDEVRVDLKNILVKLSNIIKVEMLTGDHKDNAENLANIVGIKTFHSDVTPGEKLEIIKKHSKNDHIIMVGDGINDAPALTYAHVGIAMGKIGSSTAIEASDAVLLNDDIGSIYWLIKQAKKTHRIVKENIFLALFAIGINAVLSLLGFIPLFAAVILHEGSTVLVGLNSLRLLKRT
jgi:Cd2+/Zn2+-exporting ATPase